MVLLFYFVDPTKSQKRGVVMETPAFEYLIRRQCPMTDSGKPNLDAFFSKDKQSLEVVFV